MKISNKVSQLSSYSNCDELRSVVKLQLAMNDVHSHLSFISSDPRFFVDKLRSLQSVPFFFTYITLLQTTEKRSNRYTSQPRPCAYHMALRSQRRTRLTTERQESQSSQHSSRRTQERSWKRRLF